jgi:hypothetical protein
MLLIYSATDADDLIRVTANNARAKAANQRQRLAPFSDRTAPHLGAFPCFPGPTVSPQLPFAAAPAARGLGMSIGALIKGDGATERRVVEMRPA